MRIILRPGHGLTAPAGPKIDYSPGPTRHKRWIRQRPGNKEDDYTAKYCADYLIPAMVAEGHCVYPLRAMDPVTGQLDDSPTTVGPDVLPGLTDDLATTQPRWLYNASVEGALRGINSCRDWVNRWRHDPVAACRWEASIPDSDHREMYLSIHQNWFNRPIMNGCNVLYYGRSAKRYSRAGRSMGTMIYDKILQGFKGDPWIDETALEWGKGRLQYRLKTGSRWSCAGSNLYELRNTRRPAVLIELAFASNSDDYARMHDPEWCSIMAKSIAKGISDAG